MASQRRIVDVHHHVVPPAFVKAMEVHGLSEVAGAPLPRWTPQKSIDNMDVHGIAVALLSLSAPGVNLGGQEAEAIALAKACNEYAAGIVAERPDRFGFFAVLPMPFTDAACREAIYALDTLGADGLVLLGSTDGHFLGDARFDELMAELDHRESIVFVHPNLHATSMGLGLDAPGFLLEFLCDTTRAATNLILTGTAEKYSRIRWILAHAGGFLPYVAWRLSLANEMPRFALKAPKGVLHYIRSFYYDTALSPSPFAMAALRELVAPDHILFGSDFPFAPAVVTGMEIDALAALSVLDPLALNAIYRFNALKLFPRFATSGEIEHPSALAQAKHALFRPIETLAEKIRDR